MDSDYIKALGTYITHSEDMFLVKVFYDKESLIKHASQEAVDIFLVNHAIVNDINLTNSVVIYLVDQHMEHKPDDTLTGIIFKYKKANEIIEAIKYYYEVLSGNFIENKNREGKLIGFYSSTGGTGKTVISLGVARVLASYGKRVLYLNLENIPSTSFFFPEEEATKSLADFLYYLFIKNDKTIFKGIYEFLRRDEWGVDCLVPQRSFNDWMQLTIDEIRYFISKICSDTEYDYICLDTSSHLDDKNIMMGAMCYKVFNIYTQSKISQHKQKVLSQYCKASPKLEFFNNSIMVLNRFNNGEQQPNGYTIGEDEALIKGLYLNGPFGDGIKKIVANILF